MKTMLTAFTRPRRPSGVESWMRVERATWLTWSAMPATASASTESGKERESPKTAAAAPKARTAKSNARPGRAMGRAKRSTPDMAKVPKPMADASKP